MIKLKDILLENEDWWDDSQSFDGRQKSKEQEKQNQQSLTNQLNQKYQGKSIYLKFNIDMPYDIKPEQKNKLESIYQNPFKFEFKNISKDSISIYQSHDVLGLEKNTGIFSSGYSLKKYKLIVSRISFDYFKNYIDIDLSGPFYRIYIEYMPKESAQLLFNFAKDVYLDFKPSMYSIRYGYNNKHIPIK